MLAHPSEELVGRTAEFGSLDRALAELERQRFVALELVGEPGIGKTRLLAELGERADARGHIVLAGGAAELERDLPFWVFVDALDEYVQALDPRRLDALPADVRAELGHVLPALATGDGAGGADAPDHRFRTHRAVRRLLEVLAEEKPLVLLLDDVHWADSGSIELLGTLLRRPPDAAVLIAVAVRARQLPERLSGALERSHRAGALDRIELGVLSREEARALLGDAVAGPAADALYAVTGGNPFYLRQLARAQPRADAGNGAADVALAGVVVPRDVAAALTDELAALDASARRVLDGASVAGDPFEPELAAAAAGVPAEAAVDALDALLARDLIRTTDVPRRFRFRHPLVRRTVYESSPGGWRLGAHDRCAEALDRRGAPAAARAHHVEHAARHGDAAAVAVLREAGEAVVQRTPAGAARWFAAALRLLPADAAPEERIALLGAHARALAASGQFDGAHAALLEAIALVPDDAPALRVQLIAACAAVDQLLGLHADAQARLEQARDALPDAAPAQRVALEIALSANATFRQDYAEARAWAASARAAAEPLGAPVLVAEAAASLALTCAFTDDVAAARQHRAEAAAVIDAMPDHELAAHVPAIANLFAVELYIDELEAGTAHAERSVDVARGTAQAELFPSLVPMLGSFLVLRGRLGEAAEREDGAIEAARLSGNAQALAWALFHRAFAALQAGDLDTAFAAGTESVELTRAEDSIVACFAGVILGVAVVERGDAAAGVELILANGGGPELRRIPGSWRAYYLERLTAAELSAGRRDAAAAAAARAAAIAAAGDVRFCAMTARRAAAHVALEDDPAAAAEHALASAAAADAIGAPVEAAVSRALAGVATARAGDRDGGVALLLEAAAALDARGAIRGRDAAEHELRRLGQRNLHRRTRPGTLDGSGIETLTERERQVARLIVERKTNPQIAAELFLSTKTVETHIRHLFQKLDVSSRVEVARVFERADRAS
jgi:ATP/maltotriose-dependent transcriptional regulator MalT